MSFESQFPGPNYGYILELYDRYRADPASVDESTRHLFRSWEPLESQAAMPAGVDLGKLIGLVNLAQSVRMYGYLAAKLDPLGSVPPGDPALTLDFHRLSPDDLRQLPARLVGLPEGLAAENAAAGLETLRSIYCGAIGFDYGHIRNPDERAWLQNAAETGRFRPPAIPVDGEALLERLSKVEAFELFLNRIYPGKTRFSIQGVDMLVPMLDEILAASGRANVCVMLIGMAHRGRLNVLAHVLQKPYEQILAEFKDPKGRSTTWDEMGWTGDVKYHMGGLKTPQSADHADLLMIMPSNPSHLEAVDPVILGMARAANSKVDQPGPPQQYRNAALAVLIHGDASFVGQGIVEESLNLAQLAAYDIGGSLHIITNNQLGYTATARESRSSLHASDLAKGFEMPIIHVNADEPEACLEAARTAFAYREHFHKDFVIDLIGYRRYGHNEGDEPRFTQPVMYQAIDALPPVRESWAARMEKQGSLEPGRAAQMLQQDINLLQEVNQKLDAERSLEEPVPKPPPPGAAAHVDTAVPLDRLRELNRALRQFPADFHPNPKLGRSLEKRRHILDDAEAAVVDWATGEELALATILQDGIPTRMTGQDTPRGTFSQRHAAFYDIKTNRAYVPLQSIPQVKAAFEIHNTPVSEAGPVGFEVGYNLWAAERLVIWEAQYGDFDNNIQTVVDEFLLSARAKWGATPSLVLLLPHGSEGAGPDHSSARIERFLSLASEGNVRIAIPTTAAQYFHLLRRQALLLKTDPLPLVVFTPKGFLRHPLSASAPRQLAKGGWQPLLKESDSGVKERAVKHLILCSGRVYFDLKESELRAASQNTAIVRAEQLYPFPAQAWADLLREFPALEQVVWAQEEPMNMGAWEFMRTHLRPALGEGLPLYYVGRPESSSPAEGSSTLYHLNQAALVRQAFRIEKPEHTPSVVVERG